MRNPKWILLPLTVAVLIALAWLKTSSASADSPAVPWAQPTTFPTPTPGPDGSIIYEVKPDDSLWRIAAIANMSIEELMALNGIQADDVIAPGMRLLLGTGGPAPPATLPPDAFPTETPISATPTPEFGVGEICVLLFVDENGDARLDPGEMSLTGGQISVMEADGEVAGEHTTGADELYDEDGDIQGYCFTGLENGDYSVSAAVPPEYNPTTGMNIPVRLSSGDQTFVQFGAQPSAAAGGGVVAQERDRSYLLGALGVLLLLSAGGVGYYALRMGRSRPSSLR
jgi:hypothetical protein